MKRRWTRSVIMSAVLFAVLFSSCGKETGPGAASVAQTSADKIAASADTSDKSPVTSKTPEKTKLTYTLTLASLCMDERSRLGFFVNNFNETHPDNAVEILATGKTETEKETSRLTVLSQLKEGNGPDILVLDRKMLADFKEKEKLALLEEVVSPTIRSELIPAIAELGTVDGDFVGLAPFADEVLSCAVPSGLFPYRTWTIQDVLDIMKDHPGFKRTFVYEWGGDEVDILISLYGLDLTDSGFVDYEKKKAGFYREDLVCLLERMYTDVQDPFGFFGIAKEGDALGLYMNAVDSAGLMRTFLDLGEGWDFIGLPTENGLGGRCSADCFVAVNAGTDHPDDVREFMLYVLDNAGKQGGLSVRTDAARRSLKYSEDRDSRFYGELLWVANGEPGRETLNSYGDLQIDIDRYVSRYEEFVSGLRPFERDPGIREILSEEIRDYLKTGDNADACARIINDRVQEYLDEMN